MKQYNEELADIALYGSSASNSGNTKEYRELDTVGSYEKAWRYINGCWYMFKQGNTQELISEYYSYQFLKAMDVNVAEYEIQHTKSEETGITSTFIITKDFTNNAALDFEPFCNYYTDHDEPDYIIPRLDEKLVEPYVMMVFYDALLSLVRQSLTTPVYCRFLSLFSQICCTVFREESFCTALHNDLLFRFQCVSVPYQVPEAHNSR